MPRLQNLKATMSLKVEGFVGLVFFAGFVVSFVCLFVHCFFKLLAQETQGLKILHFISRNGKKA